MARQSGKKQRFSRAGTPAHDARTIAALGAGLLALGGGALAIRKRFDPHIAKTSSGWAFIHTVRDDGDVPVRVLYQGGGYQSATYLGERRFEPVFEYCRNLDMMFDAEPAMRESLGHGIRRVLMLGGGGFAYPKHLLTTHPGIRMDAVEIDLGVVDIARKWFFLDELEERLEDPSRACGCRLDVHVADGRAFLDAAPMGRYDAVLNDAFSGREPVRPLATVEAAQAAKACMTSGGLYLANVSSCGEGADLSFLRDEVATLLQVFAHVHVVPSADETFAGEDNYLVVATDGTYGFSEVVPFDDDFLGEVLRDAER